METTEGGADSVAVSEGAVVCECPWWEDAMFPLGVRNISGIFWLRLPFCSQGEWDQDAEELRDAVPMF